jgi:hypothetical protein
MPRASGTQIEPGDLYLEESSKQDAKIDRIESPDRENRENVDSLTDYFGSTFQYKRITLIRSLPLFSGALNVPS